LDGAKPVLVAQKTTELPFPDKIGMPFSLEIKNLNKTISRLHFYNPAIKLVPVKFKRTNEKSVMVVDTVYRIGSKVRHETGFKIDEKFLGDRLADFCVPNWEKQENNLFEIASYYSIRKDGSLDLRIESSRKISQVELKDYELTKQYKLVDVKTAGLSFDHKPILSFFYENEKLVILTEEKKAICKAVIDDLRPMAQFPDFIFIDESGHEHYARVNRDTNKVQLYTNDQGRVLFSKELRKSLRKINLGTETIFLKDDT
jgi:hypothetical protein